MSGISDRRTHIDRVQDRAMEHLKFFIFEATGEKLKFMPIELDLCHYMIWRRLVQVSAEQGLSLKECTYENSLVTIQNMTFYIRNIMDLWELRERRMSASNSENPRIKTERLLTDSKRVGKSNR
jgi:hypothetical protein